MASSQFTQCLCCFVSEMQSVRWGCSRAVAEALWQLHSKTQWCSSPSFTYLGLDIKQTSSY